MGRRSHSRSLSIWANGVRVGTWTLPARGPTELRYDPAWVTSEVGRPLSLSLPFGAPDVPLTGQVVESYFDNLLPDSDPIRRRVASRFKTESTEVFDLLQAIGRDCVGAVQLLAEDEEPQGFHQVEGTPLSDEEVEQHLQRAVSDEAFGEADEPDDDFRISLAGAQEKDAFLFWEGRWMRPHGSTPTTHIFKLPLGLVGNRQADFKTSVDNEWLCLRLLRAYGLDAANAEIRTFGKQRVLVVERFDRALHPEDKWLMRLPQEDFCQANGVPPHLKYESQGGPGLRQLFGMLQGSVQPEADMTTLMTAQVLNWLLRAPDGHAKNYSVRLLPAGRFQLTKLYDVMSAYPVIGTGPNQWIERKVTMAMALLGKNRHCRMSEIQRRHFNTTAQKVGFGDSAEPVIQRILERTPAALAEVEAALPPGFSMAVAESIFNGLRAAAAALEAMPASDGA
ncbi:MAG: type II toxin-antitoxin system HipA family toxin [Burkholderiaceae bacterium]